MARKNSGWIKLYRSLTENEIWKGEPFSRGQAWVDLLLMVCHEDTETLHNGQVLLLSEGSMRTSVDFLSRRWNRSPKWVRHTLKILEGQTMVTTKGQTKGTIITIENWAFYQGQGRTKDTEKGRTKDTTNKNNKKIKKEKEKEKEKTGADGPGQEESPAAAALQQEERFVEVKAQNGRTYIYDTKEERYVD